MTKQLISIIGGVICGAILLLAIVFGVAPQVSAAFSTFGQAAQVDQTNAAYQAEITHLQTEKQNLDETKLNVAKLHVQIPATAKLNNAFEVISKAATAAHATVTSITAGDPAVYVAKEAPTQAGLPTPAPTPARTAAPKPGSPEAGRTQYPVAIVVVVKDAGAAAEFLDGLRAGPRLLANITSTAVQQPAGIQLQVAAMAFADQTGADK